MRVLITKTLKYFIIGLCLLNIKCTTAPEAPILVHMNHFVWHNTTFDLLDKNKNEHVYSNFPLLYNNEKATLYCQLHYKWEVITAKYNIDKSTYDYSVVDHFKQL